MMRIHKLLMAAAVALPLSVAGWGANAGQADIVDTAASAGSFNTLVQAVQAAGLEETLKGDGPFTVFAPTDAAFEKLPEGTLENLLKPENKDQLVKLLTYHVVADEITSDEIAGKMQSFETLSGESVKINAAARAVRVNHAAIKQPDVMASNGVIHVIDKVIMPQ